VNGQRARIYSTEAIPLRRMDYGEADRIMTVLTPFHGKVRILAKGVRRPTSRMSGHLELFNHTQLQLARGRDLQILSQASTIQAFRGIRESVVKAAHAFHLVELTDGFLQDGDSHPEVFNLLLWALGRLGEDEHVPGLIARCFELNLLSAAGYRPDLQTCLRCQTAIEPGSNGYSVNLGGTLCPACAPLVPDATPVGSDTLKLLRFLQRTPRDRLGPVQVPETVLAEAERLMRRHIEFALERRLRASDFVRQASEATPVYTP
jgi:DNA repair protein RecO (recombination protein O)